MKPKYLYLIIAALVVIFIIREVFNSSLSTKAQLKLQSEQNKSNWAVKQIQDSKIKEAELRTELEQAYILLELGRKDAAGKESRLKELKIKIKEYEAKDIETISNFRSSQLDSAFRKRYPRPDSVYFRN